MTFHYHPLERIQDVGNREQILWRNRILVKKTATVVKLDLGCFGKSIQGVFHLVRNVSLGNRVVQSVLPKVAHQAFPRAFAVGQKDRGNIFHDTGFCPFFFNKISIGDFRIQTVLNTASIKDPPIPVGRSGWI